MTKMKLIYQPVSPFNVTQQFGAHGACVNTASGSVIACDGLNPPTGYVDAYGLEGHKGVDCYAVHGQIVRCAQRGVVVDIDPNPKSGLDVRIRSLIGSDSLTCIYEHLNGYVHKIGDVVETGQVIGWAGNTGKASGTHLHFETHLNGNLVDPLSIMEETYAGKILALNSTLRYAFEQIAVMADEIGDYFRKVGSKKII